MKAMVLAAGEGTRLRPYTLQLPKPAIPFLGVPLIDYGLSLIEEVGVTDLVVNVHHMAGEIENLFRSPARSRHSVHFSDERKALLGSGGGIHHAQRFLEGAGSFVVLNGDEVILPHHPGQMKAAEKDHRDSGRLATLLVIDHPGVGQQFGGAWCQGSRVQQFSKTAVPGLKGWHYVGVIFLAPRVFGYFKDGVVEENLLYETLVTGMARGEEVDIHPIEARWFETGNPRDFREATSECLQALAQKPRSPWAQALAQFLAKQKLQAPLVEAEDALLKKSVENLSILLKEDR